MSESSGYENAPATQMLATHCAACGRPLVDAVSVESGMGPDCREKYGKWPAEVDRATINKLVHDIALDQFCSPEQAKALHDLGATRIAARVAERFATVLVEKDGEEALAVWTPKFNEDVVAAMKRVPRQWDAKRKVYIVQGGFRDVLWRALRTLGGWGYGPKGPFPLGA